MTEQRELWTTTRNAITGRIENHPARHTDPDSSHVAAKDLRTSGRLGAQRWYVLRVVAAQSEPMSAKALSDSVMGDYRMNVTFGKRLPELRALGYVEVVDALPAQLWRITAKGREALRGAA